VGAGVIDRAPPLRPPADGVDLWSVALDDAAADAGCAAAVLDEDERRWAMRGRGPVARHRMVRRAVLRWVLARYGTGPASAVRFAPDAAGRPQARGAGLPAELRFSAASSDGRCLVAVTAAGVIGADLERIRPVPEAARLARRRLDPAVAARLVQLDGPSRDRAFLEAWTRLEAYVKAAGGGLGQALDRRPPVRVPGEAATGWHLTTQPLATDHVASVALRRAPGAAPPALRWRLPTVSTLSREGGTMR
jgi:4'-phosphopantetheinyl transferase